MHGDGGGLYLRVLKSGSKQWVYVYHLDAKRREAGLGGYPAVSLTEARAKRDAARAKVLTGEVPTTRKHGMARVTSGSTFGEVALDLIGRIEDGFRSGKHREQWRSSLQQHAKPIWDMRVAEVNTAAVLTVLWPIWTKIPETADRVRGRIERVLDAARVQGLRTGENPARWKGHLSLILPEKRKRSRGHHAAMPYDQVPAFLARLRNCETPSAKMLELTVLLATRSGETIGARRCEVDLDEELWTIPAARTRAGKEHRLPLVGRALAIMREVCEGKENGDYLFPGQKPGRPASNMAMKMLLRRMDVDVTVHGFRSSFRDWASDETDFAEETVEHALAHVVGAQAHKRRDSLEKRRDLMKEWDAYCAGAVAIEQAKEALFALSQAADPHKRGKQLEGALNALFAAYGVLIAEDFRRTGEEGGVVEQVDGVIEVDHELMLVEMKWWAEKISHAELAPHLTRLMLRSGVSGLFISNSGYTPGAIEAAKGFLNYRMVVLCTVEEIVGLLGRGDDLIEFIRKKVRFARLNRMPFKKIV